MRRPQPRFLRAVLADARVAAANQGRPLPTGMLAAVALAFRLSYETDAFLALAAYRAEARLRSLGVPLLPWALRRIAIILGQIRIGPDALIQPGVYVAHGQIIVSGAAMVGPEAVLAPFSEIGPAEAGDGAPTLGKGARVGAGARLQGDIEIGANARIGANALVLESVPEGALSVGVPASIV